jgi:hypothetical protein
MKQCEMSREELVRLFDAIYPGAVRAFLEAPSGTTFWAARTCEERAIRSSQDRSSDLAKINSAAGQ